MKIKFGILSLAILSILNVSCKKDDPVHEHENENINKVEINFSSSTFNETFVWSENQIDTIILNDQEVYDVKISFFHSHDGHEEDLTEEIAQEGENHQITYTSNPSHLIEVKYLDKDQNGLAVGLASQITTIQNGSAQFRTILKHYNGTKSQENSGSTDVDIVFPMLIK